MMKNSKSHATASKEATIKSRKDMKNIRYPPANIYLCVLGNGAISSSRCLYMFSDHSKYIFNCGEGTQRLAQEHKMKLARLEHIFVTHKSWDNLAGLLGLSLTIQDMGVPQITLHGPPNLDLLYEQAKSFVYMQELKIVTRSHEKEAFKDDVMTVDYIPIHKYSAASANRFQHSYEDHHSSDSDDSESSNQKSKRICMPNNNACDTIIAYACKGHNKPGYLLIEKCMEMGVPPGPLLGELKNGANVSLPSGKIVYSKDVVSEEQKCPLFLVVECPSENFLDPFVNESKFLQYQENSTDTSQIAALVIHFTPLHILQSSNYQEWIKRFPDSTCHIMINLHNPTLNSPAMHRIQHKLNLLHPGVFKLLYEEEVNKENEDHLVQNIYQPQTLDRFHLRPFNGYDRSLGVNIQPELYIDEVNAIENFKECLQIFKTSALHYSSNKDDKKYPEITFLGTGSSIPSKARNVSGILVKICDYNYIVLDCGEGTCHQLIRTFGKEYKQILKEISCIFISHMHADHHLGLIRLLKLCKQVCEDSNLKFTEIILIGPRKLELWLKKFNSSFEEIISLYRFIDCFSLEFQATHKREYEVLRNYSNIAVETVAVQHCPDAYGVVIKPYSSEWKLVYSGDTMPCENLVTAGKDCSILIHEATMEDELAAEAILKKHSTTSEAIRIGEQMNSKYTILTHFSQRYAKIPLFNENFHNRVGCAFDNMRVFANELYILPLLIPVLKCLFAEDIEDLNAKISKRQQKQKVLKSMLQDLTET